MNYEGGQMSQVSEQNDEIDLKELFAAIWHNWWIVLSSAVIVAVLAGYYAFAVATPLYKASTRFELLNDDGGSLFGSASGLAALAGIDALGGSSKADALQDRILSRPFVAKIYEKANFFDDPLFNATLQPPSFATQVKEVMFGSNETKAFKRDDYLVMAVNALSENLEIDPRDNGIIKLTMQHPNAERASHIANIIVEQSLLDIFERERTATKNSLAYFGDQLLEVRADLDAAAAAVRDYAISNNLQSQQELTRTSSQLSQVRREIETLELSILALDKIDQSNFDGSVFARENPVAASLTFRRLLKLSRDPADWQKPSSEEVERARASLEAQKETLIVSFNAIEARAKSTGAEALELAALEREVEVQQAIYESVITQFEARSLTSGYERASGSVVEHAIPPGSPWSPKKKVVILIGLFLGGILGITFVLILSVKRGFIYTQASFQKVFQQTEVQKFNRRDFGMLNQLSLSQKQLSVTRDLMVSLGEKNHSIAIFSATPSDLAGRIAISLAKASASYDEKTVLLDLSKGKLQSFSTVATSETSEVYTRHNIAENFDLMMPDNVERFIKQSEAETRIGALKKDFDRIFLLLPEPNIETATSRIVLQCVDAALIVAESAKTNHETADAIERILAKTKISEPLLLVT